MPFQRPPKNDITGIFQLGEVSLYESEKNPEGSFKELLNCRSFRRNIEAIGGLKKLASIAGSNRISGAYKWRGTTFLFYVKDDGGTDKMHIGTFDESTFSVTDLVDIVTTNKIVFTETRDPSADGSPDAFCFTFGGSLHKMNVSGSGFTMAADITGNSSVTAVAFGNNRWHAATGLKMIFTDIAAGGDCTTFNNSADNEWADGGEFPTTFDEDLTNIMYINNRVVGFSPSKIEVKELQEVQETISGTIKSVKKEVTIGEKDGVGTSTFRKLAKYDGKIFFVDERTKRFHYMVPREDQNNEIETQEIKDNAENFRDLDFADYFMQYVPFSESIVIAARTNAEAATFDRLIWFNPDEGTFARTNWSASCAVLDSSGKLRFGSDDDNTFLAHDPEKFTDQDDAKISVVIEWNRFSTPKFWKKFKVKKFAAWLALNPDDVMAVYQSIDGGEWDQLDLDQDLDIPAGSFVSPRQLLGRTAMNTMTRNLSAETIDFIAGKLRTNAKGTTIAFRIEVDIEHLFKLKAWSITDYRVSGNIRYSSINR